MYNYNNITLYALLYVDDILITGSSSTLIHELMTQLNLKFALKRLGVPRYFLENEVLKQDDGSLLLNKAKYIHDLLFKVTTTGAKGIPTPIMSTCKLSKHDSNVMSDLFLYKSTIRAFQYLTLTQLGPFNI